MKDAEVLALRQKSRMH